MDYVAVSIGLPLAHITHVITGDSGHSHIIASVQDSVDFHTVHTIWGAIIAVMMQCKMLRLRQYARHYLEHER